MVKENEFNNQGPGKMNYLVDYIKLSMQLWTREWCWTERLLWLQIERSDLRVQIQSRKCKNNTLTLLTQLQNQNCSTPTNRGNTLVFAWISKIVGVRVLKMTCSARSRVTKCRPLGLALWECCLCSCCKSDLKRLVSLCLPGVPLGTLAVFCVVDSLVISNCP